MYCTGILMVLCVGIAQGLPPPGSHDPILEEHGTLQEDDHQNIIESPELDDLKAIEEAASEDSLNQVKEVEDSPKDIQPDVIEPPEVDDTTNEGVESQPLESEDLQSDTIEPPEVDEVIDDNVLNHVEEVEDNSEYLQKGIIEQPEIDDTTDEGVGIQPLESEDLQPDTIESPEVDEAIDENLENNIESQPLETEGLEPTEIEDLKATDGDTKDDPLNQLEEQDVPRDDSKPVNVVEETLEKGMDIRLGDEPLPPTSNQLEESDLPLENSLTEIGEPPELDETPEKEAFDELRNQLIEMAEVVAKNREDIEHLTVLLLDTLRTSEAGEEKGFEQGPVEDREESFNEP